jgi:hypothetical protein
MARKLKAFTTSAGFFDLAVSAPSMKAALEAWGAGANLFHQGFAKQTDDSGIVRATMARPGIVLRRPVGTDEEFTEDAEASGASFAGTPRTGRPRKRPVAATPPDRRDEREAAIAYDKERKRRQRQERKEAASRQREGERRDRAMAAAQAALDAAAKRHAGLVEDIEAARAALDAKAGRETVRWEREKERLEEALRQARVPRHLRPV